VVIDDTAVTPRYVVGLAPERELPIIAKIAVGSLRNKLLILLPAGLFLSAFLPVLIVPLLMLGGTYLAFEASEKILEKLAGEQHHTKAELLDAVTDPASSRTCRWRAPSAPISSCRRRSWRSPLPS
jgi:uncharacterized protein